MYAYTIWRRQRRNAVTWSSRSSNSRLAVHSCPTVTADGQDGDCSSPTRVMVSPTDNGVDEDIRTNADPLGSPTPSVSSTSSAADIPLDSILRLEAVLEQVSPFDQTGTQLADVSISGTAGSTPAQEMRKIAMAAFSLSKMAADASAAAAVRQSSLESTCFTPSAKFKASAIAASAAARLAAEGARATARCAEHERLGRAVGAAVDVAPLERHPTPTLRSSITPMADAHRQMSANFAKVLEAHGSSAAMPDEDRLASDPLPPAAASACRFAELQARLDRLRTPPDSPASSSLSEQVEPILRSSTECTINGSVAAATASSNAVGASIRGAIASAAKATKTLSSAAAGTEAVAGMATTSARAGSKALLSTASDPTATAMAGSKALLAAASDPEAVAARAKAARARAQKKVENYSFMTQLITGRSDGISVDEYRQARDLAIQKASVEEMKRKRRAIRNGSISRPVFVRKPTMGTALEALDLEALDKEMASKMGRPRT